MSIYALEDIIVDTQIIHVIEASLFHYHSGLKLNAAILLLPSLFKEDPSLLYTLNKVGKNTLQ